MWPADLMYVWPFFLKPRPYSSFLVLLVVTDCEATGLELEDLLQPSPRTSRYGYFMVPVHRAIPGMGLNPRITVGFMFETEGLPRHWIGTGLPPEVSSFPTWKPLVCPCCHCLLPEGVIRWSSDCPTSLWSSHHEQFSSKFFLRGGMSLVYMSLLRLLAYTAWP